MDYRVVCRVAPLKRDGLVAAAAHVLRQNTEKDGHIDSRRQHLNQVLHGSGEILQDCAALLSRYPLSRKPKPGHEPPIVAQMVLSAKSDWFREKFGDWQQDPSVLQPWIEANLAFLKDQYGEGLASVTMHLDEHAPHLDAFLVPIHDRKFRMHAKEGQVRQIAKRVISYGHYFTDSKRTIAAARQSGQSDDTKLGQLQTKYAESMESFGLKRGIRKSVARHIPPEDYRNLINRGSSLNNIVNVRREIEESRELLPITRADAAKIAVGIEVDTMIENRNRHATAVKYADKATNLAESAKAKRNEISELSEKVKELETEVARARESERAAVNELRSNKEYLASLRSLTPSVVAKTLEIPPEAVNSYLQTLNTKKPNAIDLVKATHDGFNFNDAILLLAQYFPEQTPSAIAENSIELGKQIIEQVKNPEPEIIPVRPLTRPEQVKNAEIQRFCNALDADNYRITLMHGEKPAINLGKNRAEDGNEKFYLPEDLTRLIPYLSARNAEGYNIFVTPKSEKYHYIFIDDLDNEKLEAFEREGYTPALLQNSSPKSFQAVSVVPKDAASKEAGNTLFRRLNRLFGDPKISGLTHPVRLPGFTNAKTKHRLPNGLQPFVRIVRAIFRLDLKAQEAAQEIDREMRPEIPPEATQKPPDGCLVPVTKQSPKRSHISFAKAWYAGQIEYWDERADLSKIDYHMAVKLRGAGWGQEAAENIIQAASPQLAQRHPRTAEYLRGKTHGLYPAPSPAPAPAEQEKGRKKLK